MPDVICHCHRKPSGVLTHRDRWPCVHLPWACGWSSFWQISTVECGLTPIEARLCSGSLERAPKCSCAETLGC